MGRPSDRRAGARQACDACEANCCNNSARRLSILSRFPTEDELKTVGAYAQSGTAKPRDAAIDLAWALMNSAEFLYRH